MRAPSRTSSTLQRQAFFCYFSGHTYFNLQENSASIQRDRARARETEREREQERERKPAPFFISMLSRAVHVCVYSGSPHFFFIREKKSKVLWLVGCLRIPPRLFSSSSSASLPHIIYITQKMYILGNKGFSFVFFNYLPRVGRVG